MAQPQVASEEVRPRAVYSIDQILGVNSSSSKNVEGKSRPPFNSKSTYNDFQVFLRHFGSGWLDVTFFPGEIYVTLEE